MNVPVATLTWTEGDVIRKLRKLARLTTAQLEEEAQVGHNTINKLENGATKEAKRDTLNKVASVFGLDWRALTDAVPRQTLTVDDEILEGLRFPHSIRHDAHPPRRVQKRRRAK